MTLRSSKRTIKMCIRQNEFRDAAQAEAGQFAEIEASRQVGRPPCGSAYAVRQLAILLQRGSTPSMSNLMSCT